MHAFNGILDTFQEENLQMILEKQTDGKNVSSFKGKLVKMIKDSCGKFDDYSISPKIR